jgi:hypothetical protein
VRVRDVSLFMLAILNFAVVDEFQVSRVDPIVQFVWEIV